MGNIADAALGPVEVKLVVVLLLMERLVAELPAGRGEIHLLNLGCDISLHVVAGEHIAEILSGDMVDVLMDEAGAVKLAENGHHAAGAVDILDMVLDG